MGKNMKKLLLFLAMGLVVLAVCGIVAANFVLEKATEKALEYVAAEGAARGVKVEFARFEDVGLKGFHTVRWRNFVAIIDAPRYISLVPGEKVVLAMGEMTLDLTRLPKGVAAITADDMGARVQKGFVPAENDVQIEGIDRGQLIAELPLDVTGMENLAASLQAAPQMVLQFLEDGKTRIPFGFRGRSTFKIGGSVEQAEIRTQKRGGYYALVMAPEDLRKIAAKLKSDLTEEEIRLVSLRPLLAPALFKITNHARAQAAAAYARDATVPEDAYRHVLWSFLLAREFGPAFAEQVTNAHEIGSIQFNTEADHRMDYNNNRVGRDYAKAGYAEGQILQMVRTAPEVIRAPR
jgi:hypothetical protein